MPTILSPGWRNGLKPGYHSPGPNFSRVRACLESRAGPGMKFTIVDAITNIEIIARGRGVGDGPRLCRTYGQGRWRKMKGLTQVRLSSGRVRRAEVHRYEAHGIGRKDFKIKRFLP
jgi:hypothetical protein